MARKESTQRQNKQLKKQDKPLTEKQEKFARYYIDTDGNASEAYRLAYNTENMKPESIWTNACQLRADAKVARRIAEIRAERAEESKIERQKVEQVLMDIILADPNDLYVADPKTGKIRMKTPSQLPKRMRNALKKIKNSRGVVEYEFNGRVEAARLLGSWNGWDAPKEVNVNNNGNMKGELRIGFDNGE